MPAAPQRDERRELPLSQWIGWMVPAAARFAPGSARPARDAITPGDAPAGALARVAPAPLRHATLAIPFGLPVVASVVAAAAGIAWQIAAPLPPNVPADIARWWPVGVLALVVPFVAPFVWGPWLARVRTRRELGAARL